MTTGKLLEQAAEVPDTLAAGRTPEQAAVLTSAPAADVLRTHAQGEP